jgi:hypothetical protein
MTERSGSLSNKLPQSRSKSVASTLIGLRQSNASRSRADFEFLLGALQRLRLAAALAATIPPLRAEVGNALTDFDRALPMVRKLRNIGEHLDEHAFGPDWRRLDGASRGPASFEWLGEEIAFDSAQIAADTLLAQLGQCRDLLRPIAANLARRRASRTPGWNWKVFLPSLLVSQNTLRSPVT